MELVLIACSQRKQEGGVPGYAPSKQLTQGLKSGSFEKLLNLRSQIVKGCKKSLPEGPDVGIPGVQMNAQYLPAYQRYTGKVYEYGRVQELYPNQSRIRLVIISALYGLLDGDDLIQEYNLKMDDKVSGQRLYTWWKRHKLVDIVEEYILSCNPVTVHDLLPINYLKALHPWPPESRRRLWKPLDCSGLGQGSSYRRGEYLATLLSGQCQE
jgi:hypothetical protein